MTVVIKLASGSVQQEHGQTLTLAVEEYGANLAGAFWFRANGAMTFIPWHQIEQVNEVKRKIAGEVA
jgi:hypothetical protein